MHTFSSQAIEVGCFQPWDLLHKTHRIIAVVIGDDKDHIFLLTIRLHQRSAQQTQ
jgi:hypothetical protein